MERSATEATPLTTLAYLAPGNLVNRTIDAVYKNWCARAIGWPLKITSAVVLMIKLAMISMDQLKMGLCAFAKAAEMTTEDRVCDVYVKGQRFSENRVAELIIHPFSFVLPISGCMYFYVFLLGFTIVHHFAKRLFASFQAC